MLITTPHFTGTYVKNLLADCPTINTIIHACTTWIKDTVDGDAKKIPFLSDQQLDDVFNGPFHVFFKQHLSAYAQISRIETALTIAKDDTFKEAEHIANPTLGLSNKLLDKMDFITLSNFRNQLNTLTQTHYAQWEALVQNWITLLLDAIKKNNLVLSDLELQEFSSNQPASELQDRITHLKAALPKLDKTHFDFEQYWIVKTTLMIQSALSRAQLPHALNDIEAQLKPLKPAFKTIADADTALRAQQQKAVEKLAKSLE